MSCFDYGGLGSISPKRNRSVLQKQSRIRVHVPRQVTVTLPTLSVDRYKSQTLRLTVEAEKLRQA